MLEVGRSDMFNTEQLTDATQNARIALNTISRDANNAGAGYWKFGAQMPDGTLERLMFLPDETDGTEDVLTPLVPGDGVKTIDVDGTNVATDAVTFVYQDDSFNGGSALKVVGINPATNAVTVNPTTDPCHDGDLYVYIIDDGNYPALGSLKEIDDAAKRLTFSAGDPLGLNNPGGTSTFRNLGASAACKRITWVTYFVNTDHVLVRRVYGNTHRIVGSGVDNDGVGGVVPEDINGEGVGFVEMPLATGVQNFQVKYVLEDGTTVDTVGPTLDAGGNPIPGTKSTNRALIRMVQVSITVRSAQADNKTKKPFFVTLNGSFYTPNLVIKERPSGNAV